MPFLEPHTGDGVLSQGASSGQPPCFIFVALCCLAKHSLLKVWLGSSPYFAQTGLKSMNEHCPENPPPPARSGGIWSLPSNCGMPWPPISGILIPHTSGFVLQYDSHSSRDLHPPGPLNSPLSLNSNCSCMPSGINFSKHARIFSPSSWPPAKPSDSKTFISITDFKHS